MKAVLFDLDNTLCDIVSARLRFIADAGQSLGLAVQTRQAAEAATAGAEAVCRLLSPEATSLPAIRNAYRKSIAWLVTPNKIAQDVVERVRSEMRVGVVTNGGLPTQMTKLKLTLGHTSLSPIVVSSRVRCRKPDARIFRHALAGLSLAAGDVLFVGDDPREDMLGASNAGMRTCWLSHGRPRSLLPCRVDLMIDSLETLPEAIHAWRA